MPIMSAILDVLADVNAEFTAPASVVCDWQQVGALNALAVKDVAIAGDPITNPAGQVTDASRQIFRRDNRMGAFLLLRMRYGGVSDGIISPVVQVFGRTGASGRWQLLQNRLGDTAVELTVDVVSDLAIGSLAHYTTPDLERHSFDTQGCDEFLVGVQTPFGPIPLPPLVTASALLVKLI